MITRALCLLILLSAPTYAGTFTGFAKISSNYVWRGQTFSDNQPMVALSGNYQLDSGLYANIYGTNLKFQESTIFEGQSSKEMDITLGYNRSFGNWRMNLYYNRYEYLDQHKISSNEYALQVGYLGTTLDYGHQPNWFGYKTSSHYLRLSHTHTFNEKFHLTAAIGHDSQEKTVRKINANGVWEGAGFTSYFDYLISLQVHEANGFIYEFSYTETNRKIITYNSQNAADDGKKVDANDESFTVSLTKTF